MPSLTSSIDHRFIEFHRNAHLMTDYYNYDKTWPPMINRTSDGPDENIPIPDLSANSELLNLVCQKTESVIESRNQFAKKAKQFESTLEKAKSIGSGDTLLKLIDQPIQFDKHLNALKTSTNSRLERQKAILCELESTKLRLTERINALNNNEDRSRQLLLEQNEYMKRQNTQRLGVLGKSDEDFRVTLRMESLTTEGLALPDRPVSLVRGVQRWDARGRLQFVNLEVISNQRNDTLTLARCAEASMVTSALIACLMWSAHVDRWLRMAIQQLRSEHALDWDSEKRHLYLLTGLHGELLATLSISPDGIFSLTRVQYQQPVDGNPCLDVGNINQMLESKLSMFTPPMSHLLDGWVTEVRDFCFELSKEI